MAEKCELRNNFKLINDQGIPPIQILITCIITGHITQTTTTQNGTNRPSKIENRGSCIEEGV